MDAYCECGEQFHIDADFAYYVKCLKCNTVYEVGGHVKFYKLDYEPESCVQIDPDQRSEIMMDEWLSERE